MRLELWRKKKMKEKQDLRNNVENLSRRKILRYLAVGALAGAALSDFSVPPKKVFASAPLVSGTQIYVPDSYLINKSGSNYQAINGTTGNIDYTNTNASVVINDAVTALTNGGLIHLAGNTTFNLTTPVSITGGNNGTNTNTWILEGEGNSSILQQKNAGIDALVISGETRVVLRNFYINMSGTAGRGIFGNCTSPNYSCFRESIIENVNIEAGGQTGGTPGAYAYMVYLINPFQSLIQRCRWSGSPTTAAFRLENGNGSGGVGTTKFFGNSNFIQLFLNLEGQAAAGCHGLSMGAATSSSIGGSSSTIMNLNNFAGLYMLNQSSTRTGSHGVSLEGGSKFNKFDFVDIEGFDTAIYLNGVGYGQNQSVYNNTFNGGFVDGISYNIYTTLETRANEFKSLNLLVGGSKGISDNGDGGSSAAGPNIFEDLGSGAFVPVSIANKAIVRGFFGNSYATNNGANTVGDGGLISHGLLATPKTVIAIGSVAGQIVTVTATSSTAFKVAIKTPSGGSGSSQTIYWQASIQ